MLKTTKSLPIIPNPILYSLLKRNFFQQPEYKVIYDGKCPVCKLGVNNLTNTKQFECIDARDSQNPLVKSLEEKGYDFDKGMAVIKGDKVYFGADALHAIGVINGKPHAKLFTNIGSMFYPSLRSIRNILIGDDTIQKQREQEKQTTKLKK